MTLNLMTFFIAIWDATFLLSPIVALIARSEYKQWRSSVRRLFLVANFSFLTIGGLILVTKWSFSGLAADAVALGAGYSAYTCLIFLISLRRPKALTWTIVGMGMIPTAIGVLLGVTMLALFFVLGDLVPRKEAWLSRNYSYRITYYGGAMADHDGADLTVLYHPTLLPFVEKEIFRKQYEDSNYAFADLNVNFSGKQILILCPRSKSAEVETTRVPNN
jgi:hypothetical protein